MQSQYKIYKYFETQRMFARTPQKTEDRELIFLNYMDFQIIKIDGFDKVILRKPGFVMAFEL